ncbi:hypothetical protein LTR10_011359 [Elasticomyces elasticus]|nr:hypothetical protein LTR10_011359 [Elasticomyces elasticus]KAK4966230.1 hypothetical protein LTR42_011391 [Elasticomyces elasticus]
MANMRTRSMTVDEASLILKQNIALQELEQSLGDGLGSQEQRDQLHARDIRHYGAALTLLPGDGVPWRTRRITNPVPEQPFRFTDLPSELRNQIYDLALCHYENDGVISPACYSACATNETSSIVFVQGAWRSGDLSRSNFGDDVSLRAHGLDQKFKDRSLLEDNSKLGPSDFDLTKAEQRSGLLEPHDIFSYEDQSDKDPAKHGFKCLHGHVCSYMCLLQPALTRASRQLRTECLPLFYSTNESRLMLNVNPNMDAANPRATKDIHPLAVKFWRTVGDTHLRTMKTFVLSLGEQCTLHFTTLPAGSFQAQLNRENLSARSRTKKAELMVSNALDEKWVTHFTKETAEREVEDLAFVQWVTEGGLCVQNIEQALVLFDYSEWTPCRHWHSRKWIPYARLRRMTVEEQAAMEARQMDVKTFW